ncbi:hypothetical protein [Rhodoferax saidenbachensis]|uniref:Uncharacterized protein n=1 Tax=Rhodoferax saidenbachensis TaxID=1484693 RepID=A0ABU1ZRH0_9BURK|nr:hypothetical protein [Rhodoferax saidenbachensis]MDR7308154.1 hypothetical protein [Rhodoferax saidenbachensis]
MQRYRIRLMFEWGGGTLWCGNAAASERFDVGPVEDRLPISENSRKYLAELSALHDTALNWEYPPDPGPWTSEEDEHFDAKAIELLSVIREELGPEYEVVYKKL